MRRFMKNKKWLIVVIVVLVLLILLGIWFLNLVYPNASKNKYGNRLKDIDKYNISETTFSDTKDKLKENDSIVDVKHSISGKIITFILTAKKDVDVSVVKELSNSILENFEESKLTYYDIQIIIINEDSKNTTYPVFGYKHRTNETFTW